MGSEEIPPISEHPYEATFWEPWRTLELFKYSLNTKRAVYNKSPRSIPKTYVVMIVDKAM